MVSHQRSSAVALSQDGVLSNHRAARANTLINEAIIGTADKDRWNALDPFKESKFIDCYTNPRLDAGSLSLRLSRNRVRNKILRKPP